MYEVLSFYFIVFELIFGNFVYKKKNWNELKKFLILIYIKSIYLLIKGVMFK